MKTYYKLPCPGCQKVVPVPAEYFGKRVACKHCKHPFIPEPRHVTGGPPRPDAESQAVHRRVTELDAELKKARAEAEAHAGATGRAGEEVAQLQGQIEALRREVQEAAESQRQETEARQQELADVRGEAEWLRALVADLQDGERRAAETEARLRTRLDEGEKALAQATAAHEEARGHVEGAAQRLSAETAALQGAVETARADAERERALVAELEKRLSQVSEEAEARLQAAITETASLRDESAAAQAACRRAEEEVESLRAERDGLIGQMRQTPGPHPGFHEVDAVVLEKALADVSPGVGWPWFDNTPPEDRPAPPRAEAAPPVSDKQLVAAQHEVTRLRKENGLLRKYLENFGVQLLEM